MTEINTYYVTFLPFPFSSSLIMSFYLLRSAVFRVLQFMLLTIHLMSPAWIKCNNGFIWHILKWHSELLQCEMYKTQYSL